jgi:hypothetical protein
MKAFFLIICFCIAFVSVDFGQSASKPRKTKSSKPAAKTPVRHVSGGREIACYVATVNDLTLSLYEVSWDSAKTINVTTDAVDHDGDVLTYRYEVSAGTIIGKGHRVDWDLTGVRPGTYTITAAVDDGCAFCGLTKTRTVRVID